MEQVKGVLYELSRGPLTIDQNTWLCIAASFLVCQLLYAITHFVSTLSSTRYNLFTKDIKIEWQTRVASTAHGLIVFPICLWVLLSDEEVWSDPVYGKSKWINFCGAIAVGYFWCDIITIIKHKIQPLWPIIIHHCVASWGIILAVSDIGGATYFGGLIFLYEATAPWNNLHWKLTQLGLENHWVTKLTGYIFTLTWFVFRVAINPFLYYQLYQYWDRLKTIHWQLQILLAGNVIFLSALNNYYFIAGPFRELVFGKKQEKKEEKIN
eukprot:TRINITY_DN10671_c0_g1_i1.p1 TRINITY_DN10671_c0_g1~~TRINITY_DN10671_c0_g1_i1.p1  ORF type:complete len:267 (+),score=36.97 TRINITY_DN10671_c0_g1_i1:116-916(+)